jgi:hypothetical protein
MTSKHTLGNKYLCKSLLYYGEEANKEPIERLFLDLRA